MFLRGVSGVLFSALLLVAGACKGGSSDEARLLDSVPEFLSAKPTVLPLPAPGDGFLVEYKGADAGNPDLVMEQFPSGDVIGGPSTVEWEDVLPRADRTSYAAGWECDGISFLVLMT